MGEIKEHYYTANEDCIPKSKVKEIFEENIEELFEEMEELDEYDEDDNEEKRELKDMVVLLKEVLQELLED